MDRGNYFTKDMFQDKSNLKGYSSKKESLHNLMDELLYPLFVLSASVFASYVVKYFSDN